MNIDHFSTVTVNQKTIVHPLSFWKFVGPIIMMLVGASLLTAACFEGQEVSALLKSGLETEALVTSVREIRNRDTKGHYRISYQSEVRFQTPQGPATITLSGKRSEGSTIKLLYDPNHPENAREKTNQSLWIGTIAFSLFGLFFFLLGSGFAFSCYRRRKEILWLLSNGNPVKATIIGVNEKTVYRKQNQRNRSSKSVTYQVVVQGIHPANGAQLRFVSDYFSAQPEINNAVGQTITVYISPTQSESYYVDLASRESIG